jgi:tRNA(fMet)-specific endonuclease VapC
MRRSDVSRSLEETYEFLSRFPSLPFDDRAADVCGRLRAEMSSQGNAIGPHDTQIAAIALARGLIVVTHNTREFTRVRGLQIEDWEA